MLGAALLSATGKRKRVRNRSRARGPGGVGKTTMGSRVCEKKSGKKTGKKGARTKKEFCGHTEEE